MTKEETAIARIKAKLAGLGVMLPGSLSKQWNVCGTPGCKCKAPQRPVRHGPYWQLSFTVGGKSSTMFIQATELTEVRRRLRNYRQFKRLALELIGAYITLTRQHGITRS